MKKDRLYLFISFVITVGIMGVFIARSKLTMHYYEFEKLFNHANQLLQERRYDEAITCYHKIIHYDSKRAVAYFNRAQAYFNQHQLVDALTDFKRVVQLQPHEKYTHVAHFKMAQICIEKEDFEQAENHLDKALKLNPNYTPAYKQRGLVHKKSGNFKKAFNDFKKINVPDDTIANQFIELGNEFRDMRLFDKALESYKKACTIKSDDALLHCQIGDMLNLLGKVELRKTGKTEKIEHAFNYYKKACVLDKNCYESFHNVGIMLSEQGNTKKAIDYFNRALEIDPDSVGAHFCLGTVYLKRGDFKRGWAGYEWRNKKKWKSKILVPNPYSSITQWDGSDLRGKKILLHSEQAFGDTFQFVRFARVAKERGGTVIVQVQKPLVEIISLCPYIDQVIAHGNKIPKVDVQVSLMSAPYVLKTMVDTIPAESYLYASDTLVMDWHKKLANDKKLKIGICWEGEISHDRGVYHSNAHIINFPLPTRSISLKTLLPLMQLDGISLYCVQKITDYTPLKKLPDDANMNIFVLDFDDSRGRFMDTAAVMKNLDLIITIDTSIAHLAGGLGVPTWIMLPHVSEWRWLESRSDTPWYKNTQLFRQPKNGDWNSVVQQIVSALQPLIKKKKQETLS